MRPAYISIFALLVSVFGVLAGNGLMTTLVPIRAELEGFGEQQIGAMGSAYFFGMLAGAILTPPLVRNLGAIITFGLSSLCGAGCILALAAFPQADLWILIRGLNGFFLAGIYAVVEAWLQGKSDNSTRGRIIGIYSIVQYAGWSFGGQFMRLAEPTAFTLFGISAAVIVIFLIPLLIVEDERPTDGAPRSRMELNWLLLTSPVGFVCAALVGAANGAFWSLTPVFASAIGMTAVGTGTLMTAIALGAATFQLPIGRISDMVDRRKLLIVLAVLACIGEVALYLFGRELAGWPLVALGFVIGGLVSTQYYVVSAHANDRAGRERVVGVASALLFLYCCGAIISPFVAGRMMEWFGASALFLLIGGIHLAVAVFTVLRVRRSPPPFPAEAGLERFSTS